ncbi:MAG: hypothetical protein M3N24_08210 [Actinomycetota bacterium]|nr:hypothetical protein [Actinomycetota bacterium]
MPRIKPKRDQKVLLAALEAATRELAEAQALWDRCLAAAEQAEIADALIAKAAGLPPSTYHDRKKRGA